MGEKIVFVTRFVPHYNISLYQTLNEKCKQNGDEFFLVTVKNPVRKSRSCVTEKIIKNHIFYDRNINFYIGKFHLYWESGVLDILKNIEPDKIITPGHVGNLTSWVFARKYKNKVFTWQCGYEYRTSKIKDFLQKIYLNSFVHHLTYHTEAKRFTMRYGIKEEYITVLHNTVDQKILKNTSYFDARDFLNKRYGIANEKKILLYVGSLLKEKKVDILIKMMNFLDDSFALLIVGDGEYRTILEKEAGKKVYFLGAQFEEKHYFFEAADIFLMPGTGGLALNEAMYYGNILLSSLGDGSAEDLVIENFNGKRIDNLASDKLAFLIDSMYKNDEISKLKENAKTMKNKYSFEKFTDLYFDTIKSYGS